ncbi:REP-associated tyrosine transposase [Endozoicomonas elysicola]|uniref:Transposase n=1 Tax=Endozoicomonas elysicola TaxID=305900 RepID=A0A081KG71_9GAMM|nr:hypothetical protein [Endozoicomonas elysicola]KEI73147.1 transposase [Endozoicomonas elysicola]
MGRSRYTFTQPDKPHFLTLTVLHWIPVFTRQNTVAILLDSLRWLMEEEFRLYAYVILENHLHLLAQSPQLDKDIARFKAYTARQLIDYLKQRKVSTILDQLAFYKKKHKSDRVLQFWQEGSRPEWVIDEDMMSQKVEYIHQNPVKRGYVDFPEHWRYSSARNYAGCEDRLLDVITVW